MKDRFLQIGVIIVGLICISGPACSEDPPDTISFGQIQPYLGCLFYFDPVSGQMRMCMPDLEKVQQRLARRNLTDSRILKLVWQANINLIDKSEIDSLASEWVNKSFIAGSQALEELGAVADHIVNKSNYYDLLDIRMSQILLTDRDFLIPLFEQLSLLFDEDQTFECVECKLKFDEYLQSLDASSSE